MGGVPIREWLTMTTITIDGPTTERTDGSVVSIGYYLDNQDRVVSRFALPHNDYEVPDAVETVKYVDSLSALPQIDPQYRD